MKLKLVVGLAILLLAAQAQALGVSDVQLNGDDATSVSDWGKNNPQTLLSESGFAWLFKDSPSPNSSFKYDEAGGITFGMNVGGTNNSPVGTWDFTWSGIAETMTVDLYVVLESGPNFVGYFFDDVVLTAASGGYEGTWEVTFTNPGGNIAGLSNLHLYVGNIKPIDPYQNPIPEPATMLLFGIGLIGLAGVARRKS